jgi:hypothetical protein
MEIFINFISHNLTGGIAIGLMVGSLLNWYTIWYYNRHIDRIEEQARYNLRKQINANSALQRQIIDMEYKYKKHQLEVHGLEIRGRIS